MLWVSEHCCSSLWCRLLIPSNKEQRTRNKSELCEARSSDVLPFRSYEFVVMLETYSR